MAALKRLGLVEYRVSKNRFGSFDIKWHAKRDGFSWMRRFRAALLKSAVRT